MEENNNNQPISPEIPVTPEVPVTPKAPAIPDIPEIPDIPAVPEVTEVPETPVVPEVPPVSEIDHMEAHPVPSLVIEDTTTPEEVVAPVMPEPVAPVEMVQPEAPATPIEAAPAEMVAPATEPVAPEVPSQVVEPVAQTPVTPVTPEATPAAPTAEVPAAPTTEEAPAKKKSNIVPIIIIVVCVLISVGVIIYRNKSNPTPTPTPTPTPSTEVDVNNLTVNQAAMNGVLLQFPTSKEAFTKLGWTWDAGFAQNNVDPGMTADGGRIGTAPGGATVMVINKDAEAKHVEDCSIYYATFYNPKDGSENVSFVGGLGYTSTTETVKARMAELNYLKGMESVGGNASSLRYFLNDDSANTNDYVEFYFVDNVLETVTISVTM